MRHCLHYTISDTAPYINWLYFFHTWGFEPRYASIANIHGCDSCRATWLATFQAEQRAKATEAMRLFKDATRLLASLADEGRHTHAILGIFPCNADGDDIILFTDSTSTSRLAFLRQQRPASPEAPCLCLADFVRPLADGTPRDRIGLFATAADQEIEQLHPDDTYHHLLAQTIADRLAEATAERLHLQVRKEIWAYAPDERLSIPDLHAERFQGIRPAVGYPSLPDQSINFDIDALLHFSDIGITLTETGAMRPHATVSGLMMSHPQARYFSVGHVGEDQLNDYARRRNLPPEYIRPFLAHAMM